MPTDRLPNPATPFVGRSRELAEIGALLGDPTCRLLTLLGPGGIGKTRLALQAAADQLPSYADGVCLVSLAPVGSPDLLPAAVASALYYTFYSAEEPHLQLVRYLHEKHILLLLDNFEHLLAATHLLTAILDAAPGVKFLVTSRERLNVQEEWALALDGLRYPDDQATDPLESYSAVKLFVQRARQVQANFSLADNAEAVKAICQRVEGMPLGLELAATWLRAMSCRQIAAQMASGLDLLTTLLRNVPERHRSLRAVFEQSWQMLSDDEGSVLMRLSAFRGGFDLEAAEQVAGASLVVLAGLADKSLLRLNADGRYDLHELLRQYAADKLDEAGEARATADRHLDYCLKLAEQSEAHEFGREQIPWFDRVEVEMDNLRAALAWSLQSEKAETGLQLAAALGWFFSERCHWSDGLACLEQMLAANPDAPASLRAKALHSAGALAGHLDDHLRAQTLCEQALALALAANDRWNTAWSLSQLGIHGEQDPERVTAQLDESLALFREIEDPMSLCHALIRRVLIANDPRQSVYNRTLLQEASIIAHEADDKIASAWVALLRGEIFWLQDHDLKRAKAYFETSLSCFREARFPWAVANVLSKLAQIEQIMERDGHAEMLYTEALRLQQERLLYNETVEDNLVGLAGLARTHGELERTTILLGAAENEVMAHHSVDSPTRGNFHRNMAEVRAQLGETAFAESWAVGKAMTREQAIAYALEGKSMLRAAHADDQPLTEPLSARELELLHLVADGYSNREIADQLVLALSTVKWYVSEILDKLGVANRTQAGIRARELGLFD